MRILGIDTTKKQAYIMLYANDKKIIEIMPPYEKHSENLLNHVEKILKQNKLQLSDIDVFANVSGPGSFTGIRVGLTTVKAFCFALNKKAINLNVFEIVKNQVKDGIMLLQCTSTCCYYADIENKKVKSFGVVNNDQLNTVITNNKNIYTIKEEQLPLNDAYKVVEIENYADLVLDAFIDRCNKQLYDENIEPFYIQLSQAERGLIDKETTNDSKKSEN